jgi:hypothetical protein
MQPISTFGHNPLIRQLVVGGGARLSTALGAAAQEAPIDEDRDAEPSEEKVRPTAQATAGDRDVDRKSTEHLNRAAHRELTSPDS